MSSKAYRDRVIEWRNEREENLRKENGWLALCGLFWLRPGINLLGSAQDCEVKLPEGFPARLGHFEWNEDAVHFHPDPETGGPLNTFSHIETKLVSDVEENPTFINFEKMSMVLIKRGKRFGIRMWDNSRPERTDHPPRTWYEIDENYRFPAVYHPYSEPRTLSFPDVSGDFSDLDVVGTISFEYKNTSSNLVVSLENDETLFLRFWDESSKSTSYPAGRYMVLKPANTNHLELDFNFSYNPPCAFTPHATCIFAPQQNRLNFYILAGEAYGHNIINEFH
ncbi:MAG: hypothetical protein A2Y54_00565 [Chloroflexi bacterium RBG_16_51_16]|nr:MAG: hypothetical protein A2Y54_00565 [Chloroflexi bacterium RBG_16_51_16]